MGSTPDERADSELLAPPTNAFGWANWQPGDPLPAGVSKHDVNRLTADLRGETRSQQPHLFEAINRDVGAFAAGRGEPHRSHTPAGRFFAMLRLLWVTDALAGVVLYRVRGSLRRHHVPVIPGVLHRLCMRWAQVCIGDPVVIEPGIYILHGQVVIDGAVRIASGVQIAPWVTIGLRAGNTLGPTLCENVVVGTGAKIIGPITIGANARIGANAVVVDDVPPDTTVGGIPARIIGDRRG